MISYILRRLLGAIPTMLIIIAVAFFMMRAAPGGPFDGERRVPPEIERNLQAAYDLDKPLLQQFLDIDLGICASRAAALFGAAPDSAAAAEQGLTTRLRPGDWLIQTKFLDERNREVRCLGGYLGKVLQGDFGPSFKNKDFTVNELIATGAPVSLILGLSAITVAVFIGMTFGIIAALNQNRPTDYSLMTVAMVGITIPTFVTAPFLVLLLGVYGVPYLTQGDGVLTAAWAQFASFMNGTLFAGGPFTENGDGRWSLPTGNWGGGAIAHLILPIAVLSLPQIAVISRLTRGSMVEVLRSNFVRTARAKGLSEFTVVTRHALRAGLLPLVSYLGPAIAGLVTGSLVVEQIFQLPGVGRYFVNGALNRDYTLVMGVIILYAGLIILLNLAADVIYRLLDPKVKFD